MKMTCTIVFACSLLAAPLAFAQATPANQPPPGQFGPPGSGGHRGMGMGMGIAPMGMWWKNPTTVSAIGLTTDQQKHMDDIFQQNRPQLMSMRSALEAEQQKLRPMLDSPNIDQANTYAEIARIADLRAELEKANAKMLLNLRALLTADQWTKLQAQRQLHRENPEAFHNQHAPGGLD